MTASTLPTADRDLLLGILALQLDFVAPADLQAALQAWYADHSLSLTHLLVDRRALSDRRVVLLEQLVTELLALHGNDSRAALAAACAARVMPVDLDELVASPRSGDQPTLPTTPSTLSGLAVPEAPEDEPQSATNRFRVLRSHARGALGEVFLALDQELHREVALKEMRAPYAASRESRARFLLEGEITGQLEHPGIVPVYGMGVHPDGRPYYAMRFIRGESLHEAIEQFHVADRHEREPSERALSLRKLLARFIQVCNAIAYAHNRGIIHRDIKPGNIMLGPYDETLVVDWGLAKALGRPDREDSTEVPLLPTSGSPTATRDGTAVGTPAFMAPEQAAGQLDRIGPPSDIYALGATLYNLLTGEPPFTGGTVTEILARVVRRDLIPPRRRNRTVPPALEAVVLKAMAANPDDRYATATDLAHDVERWLADEPVSAYPEPAWTRLQRWMRTHRVLVAGLAGLLVTALIGLGIGLWVVGNEQTKTLAERDRARGNLRLARQAVDECYHLATEEQVMQDDGMRPARLMLLKRALGFYEGFRSDKLPNAAILADEAPVLFKVAFIHYEIGEHEKARDSYERAREAFQALLDRDDGNKDLLRELAQTWNNLGNVYNVLRQRDKARQAYGEAFKRREELAARSPDDAEAQLDLVETINNQGEMELSAGQSEQARLYLEKVRHLSRQFIKDDRAVPRSLRTLGAAAHNLGNVYVRLKRRKEARESFEEAINAQQRLIDSGGWLNLSRQRGELANTLVSYATFLDEQHDLAPALKALERARVLRLALVNDNPRVAEFLAELADLDDRVGGMLRANAHREESDDDAAAMLAAARQAFDRAHDAYSRLVKDHADEPRYRDRLGLTTVDIANLLREQGKPEEALKWYDRLFDQLKTAPGREKVLLEIKALDGKAEALDKLKKYPEAVQAWDRARTLATGPEAARFRLQAAKARAKAGEVELPMSEVEALAAILDANGFYETKREACYELACICALAAAKATGDRAERCAKKAMAFLQRAKDDGLFDPERNDDAETALRSLREDDSDLEFLRSRADFKSFLAALNK